MSVSYNIIKRLQKWITYRGVGATLLQQKGTKKPSDSMHPIVYEISKTKKELKTPVFSSFAIYYTVISLDLIFVKTFITVLNNVQIRTCNALRQKHMYDYVFSLYIYFYHPCRP